MPAFTIGSFKQCKPVVFDFFLIGAEKIYAMSIHIIVINFPLESLATAPLVIRYK